MAPKIMIVLGSVRTHRMADRVAILVKNLLSQQGLEGITLDPKEHPFEMIKMPIHFYKEESLAPKWLLELNEQVKEAVGYIIVSAEYNSTVPPALGSMLDHFPLSSFLHKPAGIVTYSIGPHGGARAQVALRPFLSEIGLVTMPCKNVAVHSVHKTVDADGKCNDEWMTSELVRLVKDVEWYANALAIHKDRVPPPPFKVYTPRDFDLE